MNCKLNIKPLDVITKSIIFPGFGQIYAQHKLRGIFYMTTELSAICTWIWTNNRMKRLNKKYDEDYTAYIHAILNNEIEQRYSELNTTYEDIKSMERNRNLALGVAVTIWGINMLDAYFISKTIRSSRFGRTDSDFHFYATLNKHSQTIAIGVRYRF